MIRRIIGFKELVILGTVLSFAGCASAPPPAVASPKGTALRKRVAVVDFIDKTDYGKGRLGIAASDILEGELQRHGNFTMVSYSGLDEVLNLQALGQTGILDPSTTVNAGKVVGANAIINGSVTEFGIKKSGTSIPGVIGTKSLSARAVVDVHLIDATTGTILMSETATGEAKTRATKILNIGGEGTYDETLAGKALRSALSKLVSRVAAELDAVPWEGYVLSNEGGSVWITGGQDVDMQEGMTFTVNSKGKEVTAPNGKKYVLPGDKIGLVEVSQVLDEISQADVVTGTAKKDNTLRLP